MVIKQLFYLLFILMLLLFTVICNPTVELQMGTFRKRSPDAK